MGLFNKLAFALGRKIGRKVEKDFKSMEIKFPHSERISDLAGDFGLSPSYIKDLIRNSRKEQDLLKIKLYLSKQENVYNIDSKTLKSLRSYTTRKINLINRGD